MLSSEGFWQTTWPIISAPLFLGLGCIGTFLATSRLDARRYERDNERRSRDWQRQVLVELQETFDLHCKTAFEMMGDFRDLTGDGPQAEGPYLDRDSPFSIASSPVRAEYQRLSDRLWLLIPRCRDQELVTALWEYVFSVRLGVWLRDGDSVNEQSLKAAEAWHDAEFLIGELLSTTYA